jgi:hypothetical protein
LKYPKIDRRIAGKTQSATNRIIDTHPILARAFLRPPIRFVIIRYRCNGGLRFRPAPCSANAEKQAGAGVSAGA